MNRRCSVMLAWFPSVGAGGVAAALREREATRDGLKKPFRASWLAISGDDDWAAWSTRVLDVCTERQEPLLSFDVVYLALSADPKVRRRLLETDPGPLAVRDAESVRVTALNSTVCY